MSLETVGSWASIIGLAITICTFFLAANVNKKVNGILKSKSDKRHFNKKVISTIRDLESLQGLAEEDKTNLLYSTKQCSIISKAIELTDSSWDVLLPYENKISKKIKIILWKKRFKKIQDMYKSNIRKDTKEVIIFLNKFITFLEKEKENHE